MPIITLWKTPLGTLLKTKIGKIQLCDIWIKIRVKINSTKKLKNPYILHSSANSLYEGWDYGQLKLITMLQTPQPNQEQTFQGHSSKYSHKPKTHKKCPLTLVYQQCHKGAFCQWCDTYIWHSGDFRTFCNNHLHPNYIRRYLHYRGKSDRRLNEDSDSLKFKWKKEN